MAEMANDPDSEYFEILKNGVPLGVKEPPLKSPGIWPTKEELKGESPSHGAQKGSHGLSPWDPLATGITTGARPQEAPLCPLRLAKARWPVDAFEGRRDKGT